MQRTTLSMPSSDDVTMTGRSRNWRSLISCSSTWKPSISGISMSSSSRSNPSRLQHLQRHAAVLGRRDTVALQLEAARQQQAVDLVVVDDQQMRGPASQAAPQLTHVAIRSMLRQRANTPAPARRVAARRSRSTFARPPSSSSRAIAPSVSAPKVLLLDLSECAARRNLSASWAASAAAQIVEHRRRFLQKRVDELERKFGARGFLERFEGRAVDRGFAHHRSFAGGYLIQRLDQTLDADRLGDVVVHAGGEAHVAVALHGVRRHRDDARPFLVAASAR